MTSFRVAGEVRPLAHLIIALGIASPTLRNMAMGYEGLAASRYWAAIAKLITTDLAFPGRRTRGARPGALSNGAGWLRSAAWLRQT